MPLSPTAKREHLHTRSLDLRGYHRADGLWDIEGHLSDVKTYVFENEHRGTVGPDEPIHDMWLRLTIDEHFVIHDIEAVTDAGPYEICPAIAPNFKSMIGLKIAAGWRREIRQRLGGVEGCTHLVETLSTMGTVAFQTLFPALAKKQKGKKRLGKPPLLNSCHAFSSEGELARKYWPSFYTGPKDE